LIVRRLFHRLPVRRKSLRTVATEHRHNIEEFLRLAYPYPDRYFRFYHDGALLYDLPPAFPLQRILALNPSLAESALLPVEEDTSFFQVRGFLVLPEKVPAGNRENYLFINRRYIRQGLLQQAIYQLYKPLLSGETRPLYWLFLYIPPEQVDVNVTPSKTEARLLYELEIRSMLVSVLRKALAVSQFFLPSEWSHRPTLEMDSEPVPKQVEEKEASFPRLFGEVPEPSPSPRAEQYVVLYGRYLLVSQEKEVWVVDVQGAHERLLYERHVRGGTVASQGLLFPAHMPISAWQGEHLREMESALREQGFHVEVREGREAVLHAIPAGLSPSAGGALLKELLALVAGEELPVDWRERLAQHIARYGSPRPPYKLTPEVVERLWADLMACTEPNYSPSGRRIRYLLRESTVEGFFS
jgi:DNA mismatch repair protein MutL